MADSRVAVTPERIEPVPGEALEGKLCRSGVSADNSEQGEKKDSFFSKAYIRQLIEDTKYVVTAPARWDKKDWLTASAVMAGIAAVSLADRPVWDAARRNKTSDRDRVADVFEKFGDVEALGIVVPFYVLGHVYDNAKARAVALDGVAAAMIAGGIISPVAKFVAGRSAPRDNEGTHTFHPFGWNFHLDGGRQAFPSGHSAHAFALASVIASHYDEPWVKVSAYGTAGIAGLSRVYEGYHFLSDFVAGTLLGIAVGHTVVHFNNKMRQEKKEPAVLIVPSVGQKAVGVTLTVRLP